MEHQAEVKRQLSVLQLPAEHQQYSNHRNGNTIRFIRGNRTAFLYLYPVVSVCPCRAPVHHTVPEHRSSTLWAHDCFLIAFRNLASFDLWSTISLSFTATSGTCFDSRKWHVAASAVSWLHSARTSSLANTRRVLLNILFLSFLSYTHTPTHNWYMGADEDL